MWDRSVIRKVMDNDKDLIPHVTGVDLMVHGHTTVKDPLVFQNRIWIDTFAKSRKFTFLCLNKEKKEIM